jgi:hypothetical protein
MSPYPGSDQDPPQEILSTTEARQGVTGHGVRYVLFYGLTLAVISAVLVYWLA